MLKDTIEWHDFVDLDIRDAPFSQKCAEYDLAKNQIPLLLVSDNKHTGSFSSSAHPFHELVCVTPYEASSVLGDAVSRGVDVAKELA